MCAFVTVKECNTVIHCCFARRGFFSLAKRKKKKKSSANAQKFTQTPVGPKIKHTRANKRRQHRSPLALYLLYSIQCTPLCSNMAASSQRESARKGFGIGEMYLSGRTGQRVGERHWPYTSPGSQATTTTNSRC